MLYPFSLYIQNFSFKKEIQNLPKKSYTVERMYQEYLMIDS
jgi:hypothetical protein